MTGRVPALLLLGAISCAHAPPASRTLGDAQVRATLLPAEDAVAPGRALPLAVRFQIAPGWHIYWSDPGDSGLPTKVTLRTPPGFVVGPVRYPRPERFTSPGDIVSFGYQDETALFAEVTAPLRLPDRSVTLTARASWLACRERCVPGRADLALSVPVSRAPRRAHERVLAAHRARLPAPENHQLQERSP